MKITMQYSAGMSGPFGGKSPTVEVVLDLPHTADTDVAGTLAAIASSVAERLIRQAADPTRMEMWGELTGGTEESVGDAQSDDQTEDQEVKDEDPRQPPVYVTKDDPDYEQAMADPEPDEVGYPEDDTTTYPLPEGEPDSAR